MRTVEEVIRIVADSDYYTIGDAEPGWGRFNYLCLSLRYAARNGLITEDESIRAQISIERYLAWISKEYGLPTTTRVMIDAMVVLYKTRLNLDVDAQRKLVHKLYQDWARRPYPRSTRASRARAQEWWANAAK